MTRPAPERAAALTALGLMSGTSMDGIDLAVLRTDGVAIGAVGPWATLPYAPGLRARLEAAVRAAEAAPPAQLAEVEQALTRAHEAAVRRFVAEAGLDLAQIDLIGFHGHTQLHRPARRFTRQLGDGQMLADALEVAVINDFRSADVAAGGEGAPLAPLFHQALARPLAQPLAVLNLGGVGNVTYLDGETVIAFDTGPGNALIDDWVAAQAGLPFDRDGTLAASGQVDAERLGRLLDHPYFDRPPPKSLDRNDFSGAAVAGLSPADGAATLAALTAASVGRAWRHFPKAPDRLLVTGGGRHNANLMARLSAIVPARVDPVEAVGWQGDALEAQAFAFLAVRALYGLPLSLPGTTGVPQPTTGGVLHRPAPAETGR